jgi:fatty-acyl-CoA synthase
MTETLLDGLMMDDYPLSLTAVVERAELLSASRKVVSRRPDGRSTEPRSATAPAARAGWGRSGCS